MALNFMVVAFTRSFCVERTGATQERLGRGSLMTCSGKVLNFRSRRYTRKRKRLPRQEVQAHKETKNLSEKAGPRGCIYVSAYIYIYLSIPLAKIVYPSKKIRYIKVFEANQ